MDLISCLKGILTNITGMKIPVAAWKGFGSGLYVGHSLGIDKLNATFPSKHIDCPATISALGQLLDRKVLCS